MTNVIHDLYDEGNWKMKVTLVEFISYALNEPYTQTRFKLKRRPQ